MSPSILVQVLVVVVNNLGGSDKKEEVSDKKLVGVKVLKEDIIDRSAKPNHSKLELELANNIPQSISQIRISHNKLSEKVNRLEVLLLEVLTKLESGKVKPAVESKDKDSTEGSLNSLNPTLTNDKPMQTSELDSEEEDVTPKEFPHIPKNYEGTSSFTFFYSN